MSVQRAVIHLGAYGTGTNWVASTLARSGVSIYRQARRDLRTGELTKHFFKHYVIEKDTLSILTPPDDILFVCLVKSPLFWIGSLKRMLDANIMVARDMRALKGADMSTFVRASGTMVGARRELEGQAFVEYENLPDFWNRYASGYLQNLPSDRTHIMQYETAVSDPRAAFHAILDEVGTPRSALEVYEGRRFGTPDSDDGVGHNLAEAQLYYGDERNRLNPFKEADIAFVNEHVDVELLTKLGYQPDGSH